MLRFCVVVFFLIQTVWSPGQITVNYTADINKTNALIATFKFKEALPILDSCIGNINSTSDLNLLKKLYANRAWCYTRLAQPQKAKQDYFSLVQYVKKDSTFYASTLTKLANIYRDNSQYDSCIYYAQIALRYAEQLNDKKIKAEANMALGNGYIFKSLLEKANSYYTESQKLAEELKDSLLLAEAISNIALVYSELKNQDAALAMQMKALEKFKNNNQLIEAGNALMRIGICFKRKKDYSSAIEYYNKALAQAFSINEIKLIARCYHNLSDVFSYQLKFDSALVYNSKAMDMYKSVDSRLGILLTNQARGQLYRIMGDNGLGKENYSKALPMFLEDLRIAGEIGFNESKGKVYEELAYCYDGLDEHKKAFNYFYEYYLINDSIRNEKNASQIAEMQIKYETEKKESEIQKLNTEKLLDAEKIARQKTLNYSLLTVAASILISGILIFRNVQKKRIAEKHVAMLEKQNAIETMRSKIASDVHDDMGANLTKLGLNAQQLIAKSAFSEQKQLAEKISLQSKEVITGMREIIWASNPANDNLKSMLGFMRQYIDRFFDGTNIRPVVNFPNNIGEVTLHPEVRRNLFLILKESLNNAVKYSGTDKIDIDFNNQDENFNLNIKDYGKGIDDKNKDDFSNGLRNMQIRAEQIHSVFNITTASNKGVHISVKGKLY